MQMLFQQLLGQRGGFRRGRGGGLALHCLAELD